MANYGSTGQRWKLATLKSVESQGREVVSTLSCGHGYVSTHSTAQEARQAAELMSHYIGKRQGCRDCSKSLK